jgi:small-conductance mechanosensitive channel
VLAIFDISTGYRIVGLIHVLAMIIAFGPLFFYPSLQRAGAGATVAKLHLRLVLPALALVWALGMGLVGMSKDLWEMSQTWIVLSLIGWVVLMLVSWFLIRPSLTDPSEQARSKMASGIGITHLLLIVMLYLMIFKPGL